MQAIVTKFLPETERKPMRIKAICQRGHLIISWYDPRLDHLTHVDDKHAAVARLLCDALVTEDGARRYSNPNPDPSPWARPFVTGGLPNNASGWVYAHVFTS